MRRLLIFAPILFAGCGPVVAAAVLGAAGVGAASGGGGGSSSGGGGRGVASVGPGPVPSPLVPPPPTPPPASPRTPGPTSPPPPLPFAFETPETKVAVPGGPVAVLAADVDQDGRQDLVTANRAGNTVSILHGDGNRDFRPRVDVAVGATPAAIAMLGTAIVVANSAADTISLLVSTAGGYVRTDNATGQKPVAIAVGDFDRDGRLDVVTANETASSLSLLRNDGAGGFLAKVDFATGVHVRALVVADFDRDGALDVVTVGEESAPSLHRGDGSGGFAPRAILPIGAAVSATFVAAAPIFGTAPDLVIGLFGTDNQIVLVRNAGSFAKAAELSVREPKRGVIADVNGDGVLDIVIGSYYTGGGDTFALVGTGGGAFAPAVRLTAQFQPETPTTSRSPPSTGAAGGRSSRRTRRRTACRSGTRSSGPSGGRALPRPAVALDSVSPR